jgi:Flp pilus assembly protein CpaB
VSRRGRAIAFASSAAICAGIAFGAAGGRPGPSAQYGPLRQVVVAAAPLAPSRRLGREAIADSLELRRVPASFVPPDALAAPAQALGRRPANTIPSGGYLLSSQFAAERPTGSTRTALARGRRPVELTVGGADALGEARGRVDVVVTTAAGPAGGAGRTFVAAAGVRLLDLRPAAEGTVAGNGPATGAEASIATLALTRDQALRLIHAQSFARDLRLIGS